jgi:hypothetical protein
LAVMSLKTLLSMYGNVFESSTLALLDLPFTLLLVCKINLNPKSLN